MKNVIVAVLLSLSITGCRSSVSTQSPAQALSPEEISDQIAVLRELIIPPKGTLKADVDSVFGVPEETMELKDKVSYSTNPMHAYQLLPPKSGRYPSGDLKLNVTYRNNSLYSAHITHFVLYGRPLYADGSPERIAQQKELQAENARILADLLEIKKEYEGKLKHASWNRKQHVDSDPGPDLPRRWDEQAVVPEA